MTISQAGESRRKILVVDDEPLNIRVLHRLLKDDFDLVMATSGEEAIQMCETSPPDLVLMDVVMPGIDGIEACRRIHSLPGCDRIPIVFVSGQSEDNKDRIASEAGANDLITKPVDPKLLRACVYSLLG